MSLRNLQLVLRHRALLVDLGFDGSTQDNLTSNRYA